MIVIILFALSPACGCTLESFYGILGDFPCVTIVGDDGAGSEIVVDALGEESFGSGLSNGDKNSLCASSNEAGFRKFEKSITVGVRRPSVQIFYFRLNLHFRTVKAHT